MEVFIMANIKNDKTQVESKESQNQPVQPETKTYTPPNMDSYSTCHNLCDNTIYYSLIEGGDRKIAANGYLDMLNRDIVSLCNNSNIFFVGTDGRGSNARIYIQNPDLRVYVGFDSQDGKYTQQVLSDELCQEILDSKTQKQFEKTVNDKIISYHEKIHIMNYARKVKLNDFDRISFLEEYCGKKFKE